MLASTSVNPNQLRSRDLAILGKVVSQIEGPPWWSVLTPEVDKKRPKWSRQFKRLEWCDGLQTFSQRKMLLMLLCVEFESASQIAAS